MNVLYNLGISLYGAGIRIASWNNPKAKKMREGQKAALQKLSGEIGNNKGRFIWIHASSLGEFEQGRPLIEMIKRNDPSQKILLTFFSPSGYEVRKDYKGADVVCYLPLDTPANASQFIRIVMPRMAIFVKYEFWGNYLEELQKHEIPTYIISSIFRKGQDMQAVPYG